MRSQFRFKKFNRKFQQILVKDDMNQVEPERTKGIEYDVNCLRDVEDYSQGGNKMTERVR